MERHVHDLTSHSDIAKRMCRASILDFLKAQKTGKVQVTNYLDIDMTGLRINIPTTELEDGENLATSFTKDVVWYTHWPAHHLCWALLGNKGCITQTHMDASGMCTHVRVVLGSKIWFVALDEEVPDTNGFNNKVSWQQVILRPGDDLYMRPATRHFVVGTEDSFLVGGHFYSRNCFSRTLDTIIMEHYLGDSLTNADHSYSSIILFKLLLLYEKALVMDRTHEEPLPTSEELASLILIVLYLDQLWLQTEKAYATYPWHSTDEFAHDYSLAVKIARSVAFKMECKEKKFVRCLRVREHKVIELCIKLEKGQHDRTLSVTFKDFCKELFNDEDNDDMEVDCESAVAHSLEFEDPNTSEINTCSPLTAIEDAISQFTT
jgi:hypothetical protein